MNPFNHYFDAVYVLGLERLAQRRHLFVRQMRNAGIEFECVEGVDASEAEVSTIVEEFQRRGKTLHSKYLLASDYPDVATLRRAMTTHRVTSGRVLTPGKLCAGLGHLRVMDRIVASGARRALVLEDDAGFADGVDAILTDIIADLESPGIDGRWDLVVMGSAYPVADTVPWRDRPDFKPWSGVRPPVPHDRGPGRREIPGLDGHPLRHVFRAHEEWNGAHCYAISARAAAYLKRDALMVDPDGLLARLFAPEGAAYDCFVSHPFLAYQVLGPSWIDAVDGSRLGFDRQALSDDDGARSTSGRTNHSA